MTVDAITLVKTSQAAIEVRGLSKTAAPGEWMGKLQSLWPKIQEFLAKNPQVLPTLAGAGIGGVGGALLGGRKRRLTGALAGAGLGAGLGYAAHRYQPEGGYRPLLERLLSTKSPDKKQPLKIPGVTQVHPPYRQDPTVYGPGEKPPDQAAKDMAFNQATSSAALGGGTAAATLLPPVLRRRGTEAVASANPEHLQQGLAASLKDSDLLPAEDLARNKQLMSLLKSRPEVAKTLLLRSRAAAGTAGMNSPINVYRTGNEWSLSQPRGVAENFTVTPGQLASLTEGPQGYFGGEYTSSGSNPTTMLGGKPKYLANVGYEATPAGAITHSPGLLSSLKRRMSGSRLLANPKVRGTITGGRFLLPALAAAAPYGYAWWKRPSDPMSVMPSNQ